MNTHVIIGASGQVGEHLMTVLTANGVRVMGTSYSYAVPDLPRLDIRDRAAVDAFLEQTRPDVVYLPASLTNVDYCELHPDEGYATNVLGVQHVVTGADRLGALVVYFSSDYIFDGEAGPYRETDPAHPLCVYGMQKLIAEHYVALHCRSSLIIRTTGVYGWERQGKNFVSRLITNLRAGQTARVPIDQIGSPTYAPNLAAAVTELVLTGETGVYHVSGDTCASRYDFACEAARVFGLDPGQIQGVSTAELGQAAKRPLRGGLVVDKAAAAVHVSLLGYPAGLREMRAEKEFN
ncbi:hypothetical protein BST81_10065 [Leptolyngbya sp. 'hensonii']|uniref:SDR family oxidoreductase n=1 Tax=Leptolyngbya sp. 'hensonii' TaxID=1922337 RepID=UPI00094FE7EC|nr:SDR family oxidoreductase [Leptolyngbya sp. 'hensonii']OLP18621.1 hypothetical protein BST81_10065 [Leptolyngbya sp. 'hensonii']